ncbi:MAG: hypothetical protein QOH88_2028 [Verrucomicrobiota bacterium]|jgi:hypothetical protein
MLRFARRAGRIIPAELCADRPRLDPYQTKLPSISDLPEMFIADPSDIMSSTPNSSAQTLVGASSSPTELVLKVHTALSQIIVPATPRSLLASEPPPGKHRFLGGMPLLVQVAAWIAIACALGYVLSSIPATHEKLVKGVPQFVPCWPPTLNALFWGGPRSFLLHPAHDAKLPRQSLIRSKM